MCLKEAEQYVFLCMLTVTTVYKNISCRVSRNELANSCANN